MNGIVVGRSLYIADYTESDGESILRCHHSQLQLQSVVLAVSVVYQYIVDGVAILANLNYLQSEALLYQSELVVLAKYQLLTVLYIDGVLLTTLVVVNHIVAMVVEDYAVLQNLCYAGTFVLVSSLQNLNSTLGIGSHATGKEVTAGTEAKLGRTERILYGTVRARLRYEATG